VLHVWGMRQLCKTGATGPTLDTLYNLARDIEVQTSEALGAWGIKWAAGGLSFRPGGAGLGEPIRVDVTPEQMNALLQAYYGGLDCVPYRFAQGLPEEFRDAARTLGPALREWQAETEAEAQLAALPRRVRERLAEKAQEGVKHADATE